jgi:hypothetical protein
MADGRIRMTSSCLNEQLDDCGGGRSGKVKAWGYRMPETVSLKGGGREMARVYEIDICSSLLFLFVFLSPSLSQPVPKGVRKCCRGRGNTSPQSAVPPRPCLRTQQSVTLARDWYETHTLSLSLRKPARGLVLHIWRFSDGASRDAMNNQFIW